MGRGETILSFPKDIYDVGGFSKMADYKINMLEITTFRYTSQKQSKKHKTQI